MLGAPIVTEDLDIVHRRDAANVERVLSWPVAHDAYHGFDLANRRLPPPRELLVGRGHLNPQTDLGKLDVLGEGEGYEELVGDTIVAREGQRTVRVLTLPRLLAVKTRTGRAKDRLMLPLLIATLDEQLRKQR